MGESSGEPRLSELLSQCEDDRIASLPLEFQHMPVEILSKEFTKLNSRHPYRIHYLGPRPINSYILHKKYSRNEAEEEECDGVILHNKYTLNLRKIINSSFINEKLQNNHYYRSAMFYRAFEGMNPSLSLPDQFVFNSAFECGNLDCVIKVRPREFDLFLRIDSNTRGHTSWYYFSVKNMSATGKITLNICNLTKTTNLYEQGMRPYVFSRLKHASYGEKWRQTSAPCTFQPAEIRYEVVNQRKHLLNTFRLTFQHDFEEPYDEVFFAYSVPYTYSQLCEDLKALPKDIVKIQLLCKSLTGVDVPVLAVTGESSDRRKKNVVVTARVHPGETNGSHLLKGFIDTLCGSSKEAIEMRTRVNFFIIPMLNPDGVIMGNSRTSAAGKDLNRQFHTKRRELYPEVTGVKAFVAKLQRGFGVLMYLDFHGHSRKKNTFMYGPAYNLGDAQYYRCRILPRLVQKINSNFRFYSCSFAITESKKTTARAVMLQQFRIPYSYTIESSVGLYYDAESNKTLPFTEDGWFSMGGSLCSGVAQYLFAFEEYEQLVKERRAERMKQRERKEALFRRAGKKFVEDDLNEDDLCLVGQRRPNSLMELLEDVKQVSSHIKNQDGEISSDDHDDKEDLEAFKLAEFNTLIIQNTQKEAIYAKKAREEEDFGISQPADLRNEEVIHQTHQLKLKPATKRLVQIQVKKVIPSKQLPPKRNNTPSLVDFMTLSTLQKQPKKNFVVQNKERYNIAAKNLFPIQDKCEIVELPKKIQHIRKELLKGRGLINSLWESRAKEAEGMMGRKLIDTEGRWGQSKMFVRSSINKIQRSQSAIRTSVSFRKVRKSVSQAGRIEQSDPYMALSGLQVDNLAMTIRTFHSHK